MNLSHRRHIRSTTVWILILAFEKAPWWRALHDGRELYSAIEIRINGERFDSMPSIRYGR